MLLDYYTPEGQLLYAGRAGTGLPEAELERLWQRLQPLVVDKMPLAEPPPRGTRFGSPLMPEPREINMGGEVLIGYKGGRSEAWNEYGHRPWQRGYKDEKRFAEEARALERFKAEWAAMQGPEYRGTSFQFHHEHDGPYVESEKIHQHYLEAARRHRRR